ncbi:MAG: hypothetical protein HKN73_20010 [Gemmatimonadetes bacterium]|nr:hypothetical protein [Gemmatimonadota bacterium]
MSLTASTQGAAEYVAVSGSSAIRTVSAFARDVRDFAADNPMLVLALVALAVFFFWMTRPRMR